MKGIVLLILIFTLLCCGCATDYRTDVTLEEIVTAYELAGYKISTGTYDERLDLPQVAYLQADHPNGDYIYFTFFETAEEAREYEKEQDKPIIIGLFSVIFGEPKWVRMEAYGTVVVQYSNSKYFLPFENLLKGE